MGFAMSLDLTVGTRKAAASAEADDAAPASQLRFQELAMAVTAAFGAVLASAAGVLLYLR
jgi:hypothetical protein